MSADTGVEWVRTQASVYRNAKVLGLLALPQGHKTAVVYWFAYGYAGENGCTGKIPKAALALLQGTTKDAKRLVNAGLWEEDPGGWLIHDWGVYQPTPEYMKKLSDAGRAGAAARWAKRGAATPEPEQDSTSPPPF